MTTDQTTDFGAAFAAGQAAAPAQVIEIAGVPHLVCHDDHTVTACAELLERPARVKARPSFFDVASFVQYVTRYRDGDTAIFVDRATATLTAVLDYHEATVLSNGARWTSHVATFKARSTPEWMTWTTASGKRKSQLEFAEFLEDNLADIASPPGAEIYEIARSLEAAKSASFLSGVRLTDGQSQLRYEETITAKAGERGHLEIPERFTLGLAPFEGAERFEVVARFRYRITDGKLQLWFDLLRPHKVLEAAFDAVVATAAQGLEGTLLVHGVTG